MARIRSVHPGLFKDEAFIELSMAARVLAIGIWTLADDHGVFEWKPKLIRAEVFPGNNVEIEALIDELVEHGCIVRFEDSGRAYGVVRNFLVYQRPRQPSYRFPFPQPVASYAGEDRRKAEDLMQASGKPAAGLPQPSRSTAEKAPHSRGEEGSGEKGVNSKTTIEQAERVTPATSEAPPPSASETLSPKAENASQGSKGLAALGVPLPENWIPDEELCARVKTDFGMTEEDLQREVPAFHALNVANGTCSQNWNGTFYMFCKRWAEHKAGKAPPRVELQRMPGSEKRFTPTGADWEAQVARWSKNNSHWSRNFGPEPGMSGCKCPPKILERHGIDPRTGMAMRQPLHQAHTTGDAAPIPAETGTGG